MWNGLANYVFGTTDAGSADTEIEGTSEELTVHDTVDDEWVLVDRTVPKAMIFETGDSDTDGNKLVEEVAQSETQESDYAPEPASVSASVCTPHYRSVCLKADGMSSNGYATNQPEARCTSSWKRPLQSKFHYTTTARANKAYEMQSRCKRQRRYNYVICNGASKRTGPRNERF